MALMLAKERGNFPSARQLNHSIPDRLDLIIDKMLARDLRYRYPSCFKVIHDMESLGLAGDHLSFNPLHVASSDSGKEEGGTKR